MAQKKNLIESVNTPSLVKRMLLGAGIALILIVIFLLPVKNPNPEWGKFWMIQPLVIVPLAGAAGGAFYYFIDHYLGCQGGWRKASATILSLIVYIIGLWLGTVLGLAGTLWN
ncbi:MAG TPA: hypothetical protein VK623_05480 [Flavobacterium sp.]|nr:hypothetical protein [Flavobacterium sp.]